MALRASHCYSVNQGDIHFILRLSTSATSIKPVHLPPPPPAAHWSLLAARLLTCIKWSWIDAAWHAWHWYSWTITQVISSQREELCRIADCCWFVQPECLGSPDVLGSSLLLDLCAASLHICAYGYTPMSPLSWWTSPTPKYFLLFINMETSWWGVLPCPSMFT